VKECFLGIVRTVFFISVDSERNRHQQLCLQKKHLSTFDTSCVCHTSLVSVTFVFSFVPCGSIIFNRVRGLVQLGLIFGDYAYASPEI